MTPNVIATMVRSMNELATVRPPANEMFGSISGTFSDITTLKSFPIQEGHQELIGDLCIAKPLTPIDQLMIKAFQVKSAFPYHHHSWRCDGWRCDGIRMYESGGW
jgi:hypothetical protein